MVPPCELGNDIDDTGVSALYLSASFHILSYCPYLRLIDFSSNLLTDQGALSLAKWISLCNGSFSVRFASTFP